MNLQIRKAEIVVSSLESKEITNILDSIKVSGYTVIEDVYGRGDRGRSYNDLGRESSNSYIMTVCNSSQQVNDLIDEVVPILKKIGGICLITEANRAINIDEDSSKMNLAIDVMQDVKKVEMIINSLYLEKALAILDSIRVSGYTVIEDTSGKGDRGVSCSDLDCDFSSHYIMTVCTNEQQLNTLLEKFTPLLRKVGGICFVVDAKWISH